jgi:hypothetical protein
LGFVDPREKLLGKTKTMEEEEEEEVVVQNESLQESFVCLFVWLPGMPARRDEGVPCSTNKLFWTTLSLAVTPCSL